MISGEIGNVTVTTTNNCHLPPEHWAQRATDRIISVGEDALPAIAEQARVFKDQVYNTVNFYIREAIKEDRSKVVTLLRLADQHDLANSVERL